MSELPSLHKHRFILYITTILSKKKKSSEPWHGEHTPNGDRDVPGVSF